MADHINNDPAYAIMDGELLYSLLGSDPRKWAAAFCRIMQAHGTPCPPEITMLAWFSNAMRAQFEVLST
jgi:hypothetical protein